MDFVSTACGNARIRIDRDDIPDIVRELLIIAASLPPEKRKELLETARALLDEKAAV